MKTYLRLGADNLVVAQSYQSKAEAIKAYAKTARDLARFGQCIEASLHYAKNTDELNEYPDFILSIGPCDGIRCERA
jgi:hypothetical protein